MIETGVIAARFLNFAVALALFGVTLFPLYAGMSRLDSQPDRLTRWTNGASLSLAVAALLTALVWLAFTTASMAGALSSAVDAEALGSVLRDTRFGHVWIARLSVSALLLGLCVVRVLRSADGSRDRLIPFLAGAVLATLAGVGHAQHGEGMYNTIHVGADVAHLLAAGAWLGGLLPLAVILARGLPDSESVLRRFSGMGTLAVAVLIGSGLINSWFLVGSVSGLTATPYGQLLIAKLGVFALMLALAGLNRFWLVPALAGDAQHSAIALARLRRHVFLEQALGLVVIGIVSALGTFEPPLSNP